MADVELDGRRFESALHDTAGKEDYDRLLLISCSDAHLVMTCFATDDPSSFDTIFEKCTH